MSTVDNAHKNNTKAGTVPLSEPTAKTLQDTSVTTEAEILRITDPIIAKIAMVNPKAADFLRVGQGRAIHAIYRFQLFLDQANHWIEEHTDAQRVTDLAARVTQEEEHYEDLVSSRDTALAKRNQGVVDGALPHVAGNGAQHLEEALVRNSPPIETLAPIVPWNPASPPKKTVGDIFWTGLAPLSAGSLVGVCLGDLFGLPVYRDLTHGHVNGMLFVLIAFGTVVVYLLGKSAEAALRSLLVTHQTQSYRFPDFWVKSINSLQGAIILVMILSEGVLETYGLKGMHAKQIAEAARFNVPGVPLPLWVYLLMACIVSLPYIGYKLNRAKAELENEFCWNALVGQTYHWEQEKRSTPDYKKAYLASLNLPAIEKKIEAAADSLAALKAEYQQAQETSLPEHLREALESAGTSAREEASALFTSLEDELRPKELEGPHETVPQEASAHSPSGLRSATASAVRNSQTLLRRGREQIGRVWKGVQGLFQRKRAVSEDAAQAEGLSDT